MKNRIYWIYGTYTSVSSMQNRRRRTPKRVILLGKLGLSWDHDGLVKVSAQSIDLWDFCVYSIASIAGGRRICGLTAAP